MISFSEIRNRASNGQQNRIVTQIQRGSKRPDVVQHVVHLEKISELDAKLGVLCKVIVVFV